MNPIHALFLDDEQISIEILLEEVPWEEYGITSAAGVSSVREAKKYLQNHTVNILICDIEMPGENGLDLVEWATEFTRFSAEPMVCMILTCHPEYQFLRKAMQLGCLDYLLKPIDFSDLEACLKKAVSMIQQQRLERKSEPHVEESKGADLLNAKVFPFIEEHLSTQFSITELAEAVSLNPQYLMRLFKKSTGLSILEYVTKRRISLAKEMLIKTDWSLNVISDKLGYLNYTYFLKVFKSQEGCTPGEYRKNYNV